MANEPEWDVLLISFLDNLILFPVLTILKKFSQPNIETETPVYQPGSLQVIKADPSKVTWIFWQIYQIEIETFWQTFNLSLKLHSRLVFRLKFFFIHHAI